jgi:hypothetical protein
MKTQISNNSGLCLDVPVFGNQPVLFLERLAELQENIPQTRAKITNKVDFFRIRLFDSGGNFHSRECYESFKEYINANTIN